MATKVNRLYRRIKDVFILISFFQVLLVVNLVSANSCYTSFALKQFNDPIEIILEKTDVVFSGEAIANEKIIFEMKGEKPFVRKENTKFLVKEFYKGKEADNIFIKSVREGCSCKYSFIIGGHYLVLASKDTNEEYKMLFCDYVKELDEAQDLLKEIKLRIN